MTDQETRKDEPANGTPDATGRVQYGGGHQEGGGMVEPEEFADGGTDVLDEQHPDEPVPKPNAEPPH